MKVETRRIIFSLPASLLNDLDAFVAENKYNRSECIRYAIRELLRKKENVQKQA